MAAPAHHRTFNLTPSLPSRSKLLSATAHNSTAAIATTARVISLTVECELSSSQNPTPLKSASPRPFLSLTKTLAVSTGIIVRLTFPAPSLIGNGSGGCGGVGAGGGVGGCGDGSLWSWLLSPAAMAKTEESQPEPDHEEWHSHGLPANLVIQLNRLSGSKKYKVSEIMFLDCGRWTEVSTEDPFFIKTVPLRPGGVYTKGHLEEALRIMSNSGWFEKVDLEGKTNPDGTIGIKISFTESTWESAANKFTCINVGLMPKPERINPDMTPDEELEYLRRRHKEYWRRMEMVRPCMLPVTVQKEVLLEMLREQQGNQQLGARLMVKICDRVEKWYRDEGYVLARVVNFGNILDTDEVVCEVSEGDITQLVIQFQDKLGKFCEGNTHLGVVKREFPKQLGQGHPYNQEAAQQALRNIKSLGLFSSMELHTRPDEQNEGGFIVEIMLKELEQKSAKVEKIVPGRASLPTLASALPSVDLSFEHRNLKGLNRSILGAVTTSNFFDPEGGGIFFRFEYVHPHLDGVHNPRNRTFRASCFNDRKQSPVFTGGRRVDEVPAIWVDRIVAKVNITHESFIRQSKCTYGLVLEEVKMIDAAGNICPNGKRVSPRGVITANGPPTTLSGTGIDRMAFAQANITRDNTKFVNGAIVGARHIFQVDQGLGIGGNFPIFPRLELTGTGFIQLKQVEEGAGKPPPPVLVLHGHYGGCIGGDLPSYHAFTLGGPCSVRGYEMGELGTAQKILELAAELRIPVRNTHVYAFAEYGHDLWSSEEVDGNPTRSHRKVGHGSSYGVGVKLLDRMRLEYAVEHNNGRGTVFCILGERF